MTRAFKTVKRNMGAAGIDKVSVEMFEKNLHQNLDALMRDLKSRSYVPFPLKRVHIPKGKGKSRSPGIPAVRCRVTQEVVRRLIAPIFERMFHHDSYGLIKGCNGHMAIERNILFARKGYRVVLDADVMSFFDTISHKLFIELVAAEITDGNILGLIGKFLKSGVMEDSVLKSMKVGMPQGGVISLFLANIVLKHLDWQLHAQGYKFVRYADDFIVMCKTIPQAEKALDFVRNVIEQDLELKLSPEKTKIVKFVKEFEYLGFFISFQSARIRASSEEKFKMKIRKLTRRSHNLDAEVIERLNRVIRRTVNFFSPPFSKTITQFTLLCAWVRKRIRCIKYKRNWHSDNRRLKINIYTVSDC
jgi:group II intron reverse transcriptase/maturase